MQASLAAWCVLNVVLSLMSHLVLVKVHPVRADACASHFAAGHAAATWQIRLIDAQCKHDYGVKGGSCLVLQFL